MKSVRGVLKPEAPPIRLYNAITGSLAGDSITAGMDVGESKLSRDWLRPWKKRLKLDWNPTQSAPAINALVERHKKLSAATGGQPRVPAIGGFGMSRFKGTGGKCRPAGVSWVSMPGSASTGVLGIGLRLPHQTLSGNTSIAEAPRCR